MKKVLIGLFVILVALAASAFILIPKDLTISKVTLMQANENALFRYLSEEAKWEKWWPMKKNAKGIKEPYTFNGCTYHLNQALYHAAEVKIITEGRAYLSKVIIIPISPDSAAVKWQSTFSTSLNPIIKILDYIKAKKIKANMEIILDSLKAFNERKENIYAYNIHRTTITDTVLVATKITTTHYPSTSEIYELVENLKRYMKNRGARQTNYPMLNVTTKDSIHYTTMVGIPTDKSLKDSGNITFKRLIIYKDKTVLAEVKGSQEAIKKAYEELNVYMNDYILSPPVIHWESLITDRSKEADSTKWVTKIFVPII